MGNLWFVWVTSIGDLCNESFFGKIVYFYNIWASFEDDDVEIIGSFCILEESSSKWSNIALMSKALLVGALHFAWFGPEMCANKEVSAKIAVLVIVNHGLFT